MWYRVNISREVPSGKSTKTIIETYLCDTDNFAEAGYKVMQHWGGDCEVESVMLLKTLKPLANDRYSDKNKVYIVKVAEDFKRDDGSYVTMKYPVPFYADNNSDLQRLVQDYLEQGLDTMRVTTISETKWEIL